MVAAAITAADPAGLAGELRTAGTATVTVDGEPVALRPGRRDHHRDAAGGLGGRGRRRGDGGARARRSRRSCAGRGWPARSSGWSRRPGRTRAWTSPTGSSCGGRPATPSWPARCGEQGDDRRRGAGGELPARAPSGARQAGSPSTPTNCRAAVLAPAGVAGSGGRAGPGRGGGKSVQLCRLAGAAGDAARSSWRPRGRPTPGRLCP